MKKILTSAALALLLASSAAAHGNGYVIEEIGDGIVVEKIVPTESDITITVTSHYPLDGHRIACAAKNDAGDTIAISETIGHGRINRVVFTLPEEESDRVVGAECWLKLF